jgi:hypothetical protein
MPTQDKEERILAATRRCMDRYEVALSVLAQGEKSPYITDEFKEQLAEAKERLMSYTIAGRGKVK